jgi:hypothetical protein
MRHTVEKIADPSSTKPQRDAYYLSTKTQLASTHGTPQHQLPPHPNIHIVSFLLTQHVVPLL